MGLGEEVIGGDGEDDFLGRVVADEGDASELLLVLVVHGEESAADEEGRSSVGGEDAGELLRAEEERDDLGQEGSEVEADVDEHRTDELLGPGGSSMQHEAGHDSEAQEAVKGVVSTT